MLFSFSLSRCGGRQDRLVVRLAAAGGEINLPRRAAEHAGYGFSRLRERLRRPLSRAVQAGGISVYLI